MASNNETETCKQVDSPVINGNPADASKEDVRARSSKLGFRFPSMRGEKKSKSRAAHDLRMQMIELQLTSGTGYGWKFRQPGIYFYRIPGRGSGKRRGFMRIHLSSRRNSLRKTLTDSSYG